MLSKADIKFIKSLQVKKYRKHEQCFVVEGAKSVQELFSSDFDPLMVLGTPEFLQAITPRQGCRVEVVGEKDLEGLGEFQSNNAALAVARIRENVQPVIPPHEPVLALDDIRDPGNLGTIIRTADWYGVRYIIASPETADFYSPKVIQSTMGSFTRVSFWYDDLPIFLSQAGDRAVYGAFLDGENVHQTRFAEGGVIVIGNESRGISAEASTKVTHRITIPRIGGAESLNAATATAIILDNFRRMR